MGGLWVDYNLMTTVPGLYVARRGQLLRPRRQPARRLGADAGPGRRLLRAPATRSATTSPACSATRPVPTDDPASRRPSADVDEQTPAAGCRSAAPSRSTTTTASSARSCGTTAAWPATRSASRRRSRRSRPLREEFRKDVRVLGDRRQLNQSLEKAGRVADFFELGRADVPRRPRTARSPAAATSASSTRPRTARR